MLRTLTLLISGLLMSTGTWAVCTLARGTPTPLTIASKSIVISADAPVSTSTPIAQYDSPMVGGAGVGYDDCIKGTEYGKRVVSLSEQDTSTKIYATNISGIGIKILASNGTAFGNFPSTSYLSFSNGSMVGSLDIPPQSFYRIEFYKLNNNLRLTNATMGDTVLPAGQIGFNYILSANPASFTHSLSIGEMKIISTPACTADNARNVDFNDVTPTLLKAGVTRSLDFAIVCKSDYGSYSASASMITDTPTADGGFIRIKDSDGNMDRLKIRITDGKNKVMKIDGSTSESSSVLTSQGPAEFAWKATLLQGNSTAPAGGKFTAKAEIIFNIQ
ncbi:fimbrial protein [Pantoea agglomerans]